MAAPKTRRRTKMFKRIAFITGCAVLVGITGGLATPAIASALGAAGLLGLAGTGTPIITLTGAALASASTAAVGTGTVASGTAVITAAGATLGATVGAAIPGSK